MDIISGNRRKLILIMIHTVVWIIFLSAPYIGTDSFLLQDPHIPRLYSSLIFIAFFYLNYFFLIPYLFSKKKYLYYTLAIVLLFVLILYVNKSIHKPPPEFIERIRELGRGRKPSFLSLKISGTFLTFLFGSIALKLLESWNMREKIIKESENERIKTELSYLKHQISPHFLFNSLNSVYALAVKRSEQTPEVVLKLSDILRYVLDSKLEKQVNIKDEAEHIKKYIELQKIRLFDIVKVKFDVDETELIGKIEPMLLIPFVENAFKYGISYNEKCKIVFKLSVNNNTLSFSSENKIFIHNKTESNTGIGIKNVKRRLELLYSGNYNLDISEENGTYLLNLKINL